MPIWLNSNICLNIESVINLTLRITIGTIKKAKTKYICFVLPFWYKCQKPVCPGNPWVHGLHWSLKGVRFYLREVAFKRIQYVKMLAMIYWILLSFQAIKIWISQQFFNSKVSDTELNWGVSLTLIKIFVVWELYKRLKVKC